MDLIHFKEVNLPREDSTDKKKPVGAFRDIYQREVPVIVCYGLTLRERLVLLFTGKLWASYLTHGRPLMSSLLTVKKSRVLRPAPKEDLELIKGIKNNIPATLKAVKDAKKDIVNDPTL